MFTGEICYVWKYFKFAMYFTNKNYLKNVNSLRTRTQVDVSLFHVFDVNILVM